MDASTVPPLDYNSVGDLFLSSALYLSPQSRVILPSELVDIILNHLVAPSLIYHSFEYIKTRLANVSVVCRRWEEATRKPLYYKLVLHGPEDVTRLFQIVHTRPTLRHITRDITYRKSDQQVLPWVGLRTLLTACFSSAELDVEVGTIGNPPGTHDGRMLIHCFPRTLPPSAMPPVRSLKVHSAIFRRSVDFAKLIYAFPNNIYQMHVENAQFHPSSLCRTIVRPHYARTQPWISAGYGGITNDGSDSALCDVACGCVGVQQGLMVNEETYQHVKDVLGAFGLKSGYALCPTPKVDSLASQRDGTMYWHSVVLRIGDYGLHINKRNPHDFCEYIRVTVETRQSLDDWHNRRENAVISLIDIESSVGCDNDILEATNWKVLDEVLSQVEPVPYILFSRFFLYPNGDDILVLIANGFLSQLVSKKKVILRMDGWKLLMANQLARQVIPYEVDDVQVDAEALSTLNPNRRSKQLFCICHPLKLPEELHCIVERERRELGEALENRRRNVEHKRSHLEQKRRALEKRRQDFESWCQDFRRKHQALEKGLQGPKRNLRDFDYGLDDPQQKLRYWELKQEHQDIEQEQRGIEREHRDLEQEHWYLERKRQDMERKGDGI